MILSLEAEGRDRVSLSEIQRRADISPGFARKLAHDLVRRGWLQRIRRGAYLLNPSRAGPDALPDLDPLRLGSRLVEPYYFGFATAAELHGFFPQASRVYYLVTTKRYSAVAGPDATYRLVRVREDRFFGVTQLVRRNETLRVSDPERTVLDCLDRPEFAGGISGVAQILGHAKPRLDYRRLATYLRRFANRSLAVRTGFLLEKVRPSIRPPKRWFDALLPRADDPYVPLVHASSQGRSGPRDVRWHIIRNVDDSRIFAEGEIR